MLLSKDDQAILRAEAERLKRILEYPTPSSLANAMNPGRVQTPLMDLIDKELLLIRDAIIVMLDRQNRMSELVKQGMDIQEATEQAAIEIPDNGNNRLILSAPPQEGKSQLTTRYFPLWLLRQFPTLQIVITSFDGRVAGKFGWWIRSDIERFNGTDGTIDLGLRLVVGQKAMSQWSLTTGGSMYCVGIGGGLTSRPVDLLIIDDPVKDIKAADSTIQSLFAWDWWFTVARPRLAAFAPVMEVATAWHELDLRGRLITQQKEDEAAGIADTDVWRVVNVPALADHDPKKGEKDILGRKPGEFLMSTRGRTLAQWQATMNVTPPRYWSAQYQGKPTPGEGDVFKKKWWHRYDTVLWTRKAGGVFDVPGYEINQSWDMTFKDTKGTDYVVGGVWAKKGPDSFLIYVMRSRLDFTATLEEVLRLKRLFPRTRAIYIEEKANGAAVINVLRKQVPGIIDVNPTESKLARAEAGSVFVRSGNIWLPTKEIASETPELAWDVEGFINEHTAFDKGTHDDQVDMTSQYIKEKYILGGPAKVSSPVGAGPKEKPKVPATSAMAKRIKARQG
jgi:predicted phage terminase large subunit-like protein